MVWDPIRELQAWQERLATHHAESWAPPIDVYETAEMYVVTAEVPGLTRDEIDVSVEDSRLVLRGRRSGAAAAEGVRYHQVERGRGPFSRTFEFADSIDSAGVTADLAQGVLTVTLPKRPEPPSRTIIVR